MTGANKVLGLDNATAHMKGGTPNERTPSTDALGVPTLRPST
jgi:hypothetical protein